LSIIHVPRLAGRVVKEIIPVLPIAKLVTFVLGIDLKDVFWSRHLAAFPEFRTSLPLVTAPIIYSRR